TIDTIIIGRKIYDYVLREIGPSQYDNVHRDVYVITRTERPSIGRTTFLTGHLAELVEKLRTQEGKNIYCGGGAEVIHKLLKNGLVDEVMISIVPIWLGDGVPLVRDGFDEQVLDLGYVKSYDTRLVQIHCKRKQ